MTTKQPAITVSPAEAGDVTELGDILGRGERLAACTSD